MFYLRPGNLYKDFWIEKEVTTRDERGRIVRSYDKSSELRIKAILAGATPQEREAYRQSEHPVSHSITHRGYPKVRESQRLICEDKVYYICGVDCPGGVGIWTIYYAEQRNGDYGN